MVKAQDGKPAPDFDLATDGGGRVRLSALRGQPVVVYFYPSDGTETCTREAIDFSNSAKAFAAIGTPVIGISPDTVASHDKFKKKHDLGLILASDPDHEAIGAYGVWVEKSMYGRTFMGVERSTFLVGPDGRIVQSWRKVRLKGHVEAVLAAASTLAP